MQTTPLDPITITVTRYACPHCSRSRAKKQATAQHIDRCWKNPDNRTCKTCEHYLPYVAAEEFCNPGEWCQCGEQPEGCDVRAWPEGAPFPVTNCPKWEAKS